MSAGFPQHRWLEHQDGQDIVYCHGCENEWYRDSQDTSPPPPCPRCHGEIVEIVSEGENDPREFQRMILPSLNSFTEALLGNSARDDRGFGLFDPTPGTTQGHNHSSQPNHNRDYRQPNMFDYDDPEEADIGDIEEHEVHGPNNTYMYRTVSSFQTRSRSGQSQQNGTSPRRAGPGGQPTSGTDPSDPEAMMNTFSDFLNGFRTQAGPSSPDAFRSAQQQQQQHQQQQQSPQAFPFGDPGIGIPISHVRRTTFSGPRFHGGTTSFTIATGPIRTTGGAPGDFNSVFRNIMGNVGPPDMGDEQNRPAGLPPGFPAALHHILSALLGRENMAFGDSVHSDEALDRIISMLMENNTAQRGAPPASQTAIDALEKKKVDAKLLGPEGHAECTICISEVKLDEEVVSLPCKHWFHEDCVVMWLKQHNTCPVCRNPVDSGPSAAAGGAGTPAANAGSAENSRPNIRNLFGFGGDGADDGAANQSSSGQGSANAGASASASASASGAGSAANASSSAAMGGTGDRSMPPPNPLSASATALRNQERFNVIRRRAGLPTNYYRSSREPERSPSGRRRRDSHSPNPGPPFVGSNTRRFNLYQGYDDILGPREDVSSRNSQHRSPSSHGSGNPYRWRPDEASRNRGRESDQESDRGRDPMLSGTDSQAGPARMTTWVPNAAYIHFSGGDSGFFGGSGDHANAGAGGNSSSTSSTSSNNNNNNNGSGSASTGGLFGFLNRFAGNGHSSNTRRRS